MTRPERPGRDEDRPYATTSSRVDPWTAGQRRRRDVTTPTGEQECHGRVATAPVAVDLRDQIEHFLAIATRALPGA